MKDRLNKNIDRTYQLLVKTTDDCLETMWNKDEFDPEITDVIIKHMEKLMSKALGDNKVIVIPYTATVNQNINNNLDFKEKRRQIDECFKNKDYEGVQRVKEAYARRKKRELYSKSAKCARDHWMQSKIGKYYYNMNEFSKMIMNDVPHDEELDNKLEQLENENTD